MESSAAKIPDPISVISVNVVVTVLLPTVEVSRSPKVVLFGKMLFPFAFIQRILSDSSVPETEQA